MCGNSLCHLYNTSVNPKFFPNNVCLHMLKWLGTKDCSSSGKGGAEFRKCREGVLERGKAESRGTEGCFSWKEPGKHGTQPFPTSRPVQPPLYPGLEHSYSALSLHLVQSERHPLRAPGSHPLSHTLFPHLPFRFSA